MAILGVPSTIVDVHVVLPLSFEEAGRLVRLGERYGFREQQVCICSLRRQDYLSCRSIGRLFVNN